MSFELGSLFLGVLELLSKIDATILSNSGASFICFSNVSCVILLQWQTAVRLGMAGFVFVCVVLAFYWHIFWVLSVMVSSFNER